MTTDENRCPILLCADSDEPGNDTVDEGMAPHADAVVASCADAVVASCVDAGVVPCADTEKERVVAINNAHKENSFPCFRRFPELCDVLYGWRCVFIDIKIEGYNSITLNLTLS